MSPAFPDFRTVTLQAGSTWVGAVEALHGHGAVAAIGNCFVTGDVSDVSAGTCGKSHLIASAAWVDQLDRDPPDLSRRRDWLLQS